MILSESHADSEIAFRKHRPKRRARRPLIMQRLFRSVLRTLPAIFAASFVQARAADWRPDFRPPALAIEGAKIVVAADITIETGTIVIRKGIVEAVGKTEEVKIPPDAFVVAGKGLTIYPGWIDAYTLTGLGTGASRSRTGAGRSMPLNEFSSPFTPPDDRIGITPEFTVADSLNLGDPTAEGRRKLGFTSQIVAPGGAIMTGKGALASTTGYPRREILIVPHVGLHVNLRTPFDPNPSPPVVDSPSLAPPRFRGRQPGGPSGYPSALMGVIAHLRQQISDASHYRQLQEHSRRHGGPRHAQVPVERSRRAGGLVEERRRPLRRNPHSHPCRVEGSAEACAALGKPLGCKDRRLDPNSGGHFEHSDT